MAAKRKTTAVKVKKKKWFPVHAPAQFNNALLGETYVNEESELDGKYLTANLSTLTRSMRKQNVNVQFRVDKVEEGKAHTIIVGYSLINSAMKRLVRRGRDKIADSFLAKTKNKEVLRIKPLIITNNKGTKSLQTAIRLESRRVVREYVFSKDTQELLHEIVEVKLQKKIKEAVAKIFPVKTVEIRMAKLEENSKVVVTDDDVVSEKVTIRKKDKGNQMEDQTKATEQAPVAEAALADDEVVSDENEFDENETVEEEMADAQAQDLDEADESDKEVVVDEPAQVESEEGEAVEDSSDEEEKKD